MEELCGNPLFCKLYIYYPTKEINWSYHTQSIMLISEAIGWQLKQTKSVPGMKYILLNCYYRCPEDPQSNTNYYFLLLVAWKNWAKHTIAENITHMGHRAWRYRADADQESSTLLATSHCTRRC